jgi:putative restriction endonuclease
MKFYIGITDGNWFQLLRDLKPEEINFWRPMARSEFKVLQPGEPFLFKLHYPQNFIVGGGFFVKYSRMPLSIAWEIFETKNGASNIMTFAQDIHRYREKRSSDFEPDPWIGCIILNSPFFFDDRDWIPAPENWSSNIVTGKTYDTSDMIGLDIWSEVQIRLSSMQGVASNAQIAKGFSETRGRYGAEYLAKARLGQGAFRILVTDAYSQRCAITGERTLPALQAAHIKPFARLGPHSINNGILLRADLHILLDKGYITINKDLVVEVSRCIKEEFENGKDYYALNGRKLVIVPSIAQFYPANEYIEWHNQTIFRR